MWAKRLEMGKILRLLQKGSQIARPWATQLMCFTTRENKKLKEMSTMVDVSYDGGNSLVRSD